MTTNGSCNTGTDGAGPRPSFARGHSLGALFLLTAACAVLVALLIPVRQLLAIGAIGYPRLLGSICIGAGAVCCLGIVIGLHHHRKQIGGAMGGLVGLVLGGLAGPLALVPLQEARHVLLTSLIGSLLLVGASLLFRLLSR